MHRKRSDLLPIVALGILTTLVGLFVARSWLPEWQPQDWADRQFYLDSQRAVAEHLGVELESSDSQIEWVTSEVESLPADEMESLGLELTRGDPGMLVRVSQPVGWHGVSGGRLVTDFNAEGQLRGFAWRPLRFTSLYQSILTRYEVDLEPRDVANLLLAPDEHLDSEPLRGRVSGMEVALFPLVGADTEHLRIGIASQLAVEARRQAGSADHGRHVLQHRTFSRFWQRLALRGLLFVLVAVLFLRLLVRRRIDFRDGLMLGALSLAVSLASLAGQLAGGVSWWQSLSTAGFAAFFLVLLWSVAESWIRTTEAGFTTSLDLLRAGRLGPRGGRALIAGWGWGLVLAGVDLHLHATAVRIPGLFQLEPSFALPVFGATGHPFYRGPATAAIVVLALAAACRTLRARHRPLGATLLAALLLMPGSELGPGGFGLLSSLMLAGVMVASYRGHGLAALLVASFVSLLTPPVAHTLLLGRPPTSGVVVAAGLWLLLPVLGLVGLRRAREHGQEALVPAFVQRVEDERRVQVEMELLARMQLGMLPGGPPRPGGFELAAESIVASEAGGDLYEFIEDDDGGLWVAAGDVAGHGYSCTIELAMIKASLHSLVAADKSPAEILQRIDQVLRKGRSVRSFTSLCLLRLLPAEGRVVVSNAGHPFPWVVRDGSAEEIDLPSLPLGQGPARTYVDRTLDLEPGAALVLFSDGLFEALCPEGRPYGFDRVERTLVEASDRSAAALLAALVADWRQHRGTQPADDDTSLVVLRRRP